jgi:DNA-binding transcriptional MocR family regulator
MIPLLQTSQINIPTDFIDLGLGDPQFRLLPLESIRRAAEICFDQNDHSFLQYGAEQGDGYFRRALAGFLSQGYGFEVGPEKLFITSGASGGLDLICTLFTRPGDTILVEEPTYFLALRIFKDHDLRVVSIQTDKDGLVIEDLKQKLIESKPKLLYIIPTFQNPSGQTLSQERREELEKLSKELDLLVVADEVYHFLSYGIKPPMPLAAYAENGNVISLNSFSKILAPGLRLGWIQTDSEKIKRLAECGLLDSGGGMNPFTSSIVRFMIESGDLERNIVELRAIYGSRIKVMDNALQQYLPDVQYTVPQGGYFFWVRLPGQVNSQELQEIAKAFKVGFRPGIRFSSQGGMQEYIRLSVSFYEAEQIEQGVRRLKEFLEKNKA